MNSNDDLVRKLIEYRSKYSEVSLTHWLTYEVFSWQWWASIFLYLIPLYLWWKVVDKRRLFEIMIFGLLVNVFSSFLDVVGTDFALWEYTIKVLPNVPLFFPIDYIDIPVTYMIMYQYFPKWKHFILSIVVVASVFSFIGEPLVVWTKMYIPTHWKYIYSFPIYILIAIVCKGAIQWFLKKIES